MFISNGVIDRCYNYVIYYGSIHRDPHCQMRMSNIIVARILPGERAPERLAPRRAGWAWRGLVRRKICVDAAGALRAALLASGSFTGL